MGQQSLLIYETAGGGTMESLGANDGGFRPAEPLAVDVKHAAAMLGICTKTVRREIDRGELAVVRIGKAVRIRVAEVHSYLKRKEKKY
jgi:excisionase family DNA binding protein